MTSAEVPHVMERAMARSRHPSARATGAHLTTRVRRIDRAWPPGPGPHREVAAATTAVRGVQGRTREGFAAAYGLTLGEVEALEAGEVAVQAVPVPLRVLTFLVPLSRALAGGAPRAG